MSQTVDSILRDILVRHGTTLLDDQRRCEACVRDAIMSKREMAGVIAALKSGIAGQLRQYQESGLTQVAVANYVDRMAEETGLTEDLCRSSLQGWAFALRIDLPGEEHIPDEGRAPDTETTSSGGEKGPARPEVDVVPSLAVAGRTHWLIWVFAIQGVALVAMQGYRNLPIAVMTYLLGSLFVLAAALVRREARRIKWPLMTLCAATLLLAGFYTVILGGASTAQSLVAALLAAVGAVGLLLWKPTAPTVAATTDRAAIAALLAALLTIWRLGFETGGIITGVNAGYLFHPRFIWLWLNLPVACALAWLSFSIISGTRAQLPRLVSVLLLAASALLCLADLIALQSYDPTGRLPGFLYAMPVVGVIANIGAAALAAIRRNDAIGPPRSNETARA